MVFNSILLLIVAYFFGRHPAHSEMQQSWSPYHVVVCGRNLAQISNKQKQLLKLCWREPDQCRFQSNDTIYLERTHQWLVHRHHATRIVKLSAVVWCRK